MFNTKEEELKFNRLIELSNILHVPLVYGIVEYKVLDKNGIVKLSKSWYMRSWTRNAYNAITDFCFGKEYGSTFGDGSLARKRTGGTLDSSGFSSNITLATNGYAATAGTTTRGLRIGTSNQDESINDFELIALMAHATMNYGACALTRTWDGTGRYIQCQWNRNFTNVSGVTQTIAEAGAVFLPSTGDNFLFIRDLVNPPVDVPNGDIFALTYNIRITFPNF